MANTEFINLLRKGAVEWNRWRVENKHILPDLSGENLSTIDLSGADLHGVHLCNAKLDGGNLQGADLRFSNLSDVDLRVADLRDAKLEEADLQGADLRDADLRDADLYRTNLHGAHFRDGDLRNANLQDADLRFVDFQGANFYGANLEGARLEFANLHGANLSNANLCGARLSDTILSNVGLKGAKNLESCNHLGPSTIDHRTLERSDMLPTIFLRGCGFPDSLIEYYPSFLNQSISFYSCFISYSHSDKIFARRLHDQLQGRGIRCWLDEHQMLPGDKIIEQVDQGIRLWDKVLLCASEQSLSSWWVGAEIEKAFKKEETLMKQRGKEVLSLIPLNLDGHLFNWENAWADKINSRHAPDFSGWGTNNEVFEHSFERVVKALQADNTGRESPPISKL